ncbi:PIG-L family deacetylase [Streptomyces sp. Li-HN-5-11]|uniref:PIG-L family deacetylase n=1 Tax=Streptomyces sp. Li-HN-5-11 TaxID=3075432 RepID=UPI0028AF9647|nr:PIG-L family deacetylase [Streptomyces sp. Li-HN-5-11]WNM33621.1 PIG-L family deacetylase [Streptomyces sp. Li-HN-5-11]
MDRRQLLKATGAGAVTVGAGAGLCAWLATDGGASNALGAPVLEKQAATAGAKQAFLHVMAHADDNLYFMNPDLEQSIRSGARSVTVCLTGGESDGHNVQAHDPTAGTVPYDRARFARARMNGVRRAHAVMATGDAESPWDVDAVSLIPGFQVEVQTLRAAPGNQLVFLELVEARALFTPKKDCLRGLWRGATDTLATLPPTGTPVRERYEYTRDQLIDSLTAIMEQVRPTVVRTLDPNAVHMADKPPLSSRDPRLRGFHYHDHQDHTASAHFAQAALAQYWGREHSRPVAVESYLGYETAALPNNIDLKTARRKGDLLSVYGWADGKDCGDEAGCGDRKVGGTAFDGGSRNWTRSTYLRAPGSNSWLLPLADNRLAAFAVLDGTAHCWVETAPGSGAFGGPHGLGGEMFEGQLFALRHNDGKIQLFAARTVLPSGKRAHRRELMAAIQCGTGDGGVPVFGAWESLGAPDSAPAKSLEMGYPAAVAGKDGAVHVFVRNWDGGVSHRSGVRGRQWTDWRRVECLPGKYPQVVDGLDACVDSAGLIHLVAPNAKSVLHWVSREPGGLPRPVPAAGLPRPAGPVSVVPLAGGGIRIAYRLPVTAQTLLADWERRSGGWQVIGKAEPIGGHGRVSAAAVGPQGRRTAIAGRDDEGMVRVATVDGGPGRWQTGKVLHTAAPAVARDANGRAVVAALGTDARLYTARQASGTGSRGSDLTFAVWSAADGQ